MWYYIQCFCTMNSYFNSQNVPGLALNSFEFGMWIQCAGWVFVFFMLFRKMHSLEKIGKNWFFWRPSWISMAILDFHTGHIYFYNQYKTETICAEFHAVTTRRNIFFYNYFYKYAFVALILSIKGGGCTLILVTSYCIFLSFLQK